MDFKVLQEQFKDNKDFTSALAEIEAKYTALSGMKETAVTNESNLRTVKQEIAKALGFEENIPSNEIVSKIAEKLTGYEKTISSFKENASGKELENASVNEQLATLTKELGDITGKFEGERATNELNTLKGNARKALADNGITDPKAQDMLLSANISKLSGIEDLNAFAKQAAEDNPFLTESVHIGGAGTTGSAVDQTALAEKEITYGMPVAEEAAILKARRENGVT